MERVGVRRKVMFDLKRSPGKFHAWLAARGKSAALSLFAVVCCCTWALGLLSFFPMLG